jgi:hypothetical protein
MGADRAGAAATAGVRRGVLWVWRLREIIRRARLAATVEGLTIDGQKRGGTSPRYN